MVTLWGRHEYFYFTDGNAEASRGFAALRLKAESRVWTQLFLPAKPVSLNGSAHSVFAKQSQHDYLIRFSELNRKMDDMIGRKAWATESFFQWRMEDHRDWPPERREHKRSLHRPEGLHIESESGSAFARLPRAPGILDIPPKRRERQVQGRAITLPACRGKQRSLCCCCWSSAMIDGGPFVEPEAIIHRGQWPTGTQHIWRRVWNRQKQDYVKQSQRKFVRSLIFRALTSSGTKLFLCKNY